MTDADEPLPVHDFDETPLPDWQRICGVGVAMVLLACGGAIVIAFTVRIVVDLWP